MQQLSCILESMLHWDPARRCTVEQALAHPYLAAFHNAAAEPVATSLYEFDLDEETDPKAALLREVCRFRPQLQLSLRLEQRSKRCKPQTERSHSAERDWPRYGDRLSGRAVGGGAPGGRVVARAPQAGSVAHK